jgi:hypothetical protein
MKLNTIKRTAICLSLFTAFSCTDNFEDINSNPYGATDALLEQDFNNIKSLYGPIFNNIIVLDPVWMYQVQQGLQGDIWSGYMSTPTGFAGGSNNTTYNLIDGWNGFAWSAAYSNIMANTLKLEQRTKGKYDQFYALSLILKVEGMHRITDIYGPIVYSEFGTTNPVIAYDSQEDVYSKMFVELDEAVSLLTPLITADGVTEFTGTDISGYKGDFKKWVKFANTLRLRLAMRIVKVNPTLAKTEAEKAVSNSVGLIATSDEIFKIVSQNFSNPIATISAAWEDIRMSADMESILGGYNDPRMAVYFGVSKQFPGQYKGVRTGIEISAKADHSDFSPIGSIVNSNEIVLMTAAESYFLRAEGALRGWNMGSDAKSLYEQGIAASFDQHKLSDAATYIADNSKLAKAYVDPNFSINNASAVNNVTIAWDATASNEVKLQKIITQKWIAGFPEGQEAWSEWRRTGYPKLFPVLKNTSGGVISSTLGVRRVNFVSSEKAGNPGGVATGVTKLGGLDNGATRIWWDVDTTNF